MTDHPILMTGGNVLAIFKDLKAQTRRIIKPQPVWKDGGWYWQHSKYDNGYGVKYFHSSEITESLLKGMAECSPYGKPGDRLIIREAYQIRNCYQKEQSVSGIYLADNEPFYVKLLDREWELWSKRKKPYAKTGGMFMYNSLARLRPPIVSVRVERVQEISEEDIQKEGIDLRNDRFRINQIRFMGLWDSINAKPKLCKHNPYTNAKEICYVGYPWEEIRTERILPSGKKEYIVGNPMVWPIEFKRIEL